MYIPGFVGRTLLSLGAMLYCSTALSSDLSIRLSGLEEIKGEVLVVVYDSATGMKNHQAFKTDIKAVTEKNMLIHFTDVPEGEYAVMVYQDLDGNKKLNRNLIGIPNEPYGFSNNPSLMGPPRFEQLRFQQTKLGQVLNISLN